MEETSPTQGLTVFKPSVPISANWQKSKLRQNQARKGNAHHNERKANGTRNLLCKKGDKILTQIAPMRSPQHNKFINREKKLKKGGVARTQRKRAPPETTVIEREWAFVKTRRAPTNRATSNGALLDLKIVRFRIRTGSRNGAKIARGPTQSLPSSRSRLFESVFISEQKKGKRS